MTHLTMNATDTMITLADISELYRMVTLNI